MTYKTNEGKTYAIVGTVDGTVISASGVVIASFTANKQAYFTAPEGGYVTISDETAIVTPVFKLAPGALVGESGGGDTPEEAQNTLSYTFEEDGSYSVTGGNLNGFVNGVELYRKDKDILSFNADLSNLVDGENMFRGATSLTSFSSDTSSLTNGAYMFSGCESLTSFRGDLSSLKDGQFMFTYDPNAVVGGAFNGPRLDKESLINIFSTLSTVDNEPTFSLALSMEMMREEESNPTGEFATALISAMQKGWKMDFMFY